MPVSSTITILQNLLIIASLVVVAIAFVISWYFSSRIANPITQMQQGAEQLAQGNYNTRFSGKGYHEAESLSSALNIATERLSKLDEMRQELFSNVSHDLKTPLTNILLYTELLDNSCESKSENQKEYLEIIQKEVRYLNQLVEDMNDISQKSIDLSIEVFNLSKLMMKLLEIVSLANTDENIRFESYIEEGVIVKGDRIKIEQVIRNFVLNSLKYNSNPSNVIEINLNKKGNKALVEVIDQGDGIAAEEIPLIWDRYYRGISNFHRQKSGSGLGLSIAKSILEQHGLIYGVNSEKGKGARFYFEMEIVNGNNS